MPKSISVTKKWTVTEYNATIPTNPADGAIHVKGTAEILDANNVVLIAQQFEYVISGIDAQSQQPKLVLLFTDVVTRMQAYLVAQIPAPVAYFYATRDALYAQLQTDGVIPVEAQ
jgi:hypothetical protein